MTLKKFVLTCMLATSPLIGFADVSPETTLAPNPVLMQSSSVQSAQPLQLDTSKLNLASAHSMVFDLSTNTPIFSKHENEVVPIASITKLMTSMVVLDAKLPMDEMLTVSEEDKDHLKKTHSRMRVGTQLSRYELMRLALMSSENRAAAALGRNYPGGLPAFVRAMNAKAQSLKMTHSHFQDSTGLSSGNVSTAEDLVKMVTAASGYQQIHEFTTTAQHTMQADTPHYVLDYHNTNVLVQNEQWDIKVSKTGYTDEAGRCLVMVVNVANRPLAMVFLDAVGKRTTVGDATRARRWIETETGTVMAEASKPRHVKPMLMGDTHPRKHRSKLVATKTNTAKLSKPIVLARAASSKTELAEQSGNQTGNQKAAKHSTTHSKSHKESAKQTAQTKPASKSSKAVSHKKKADAENVDAQTTSLGKKAIAKTGGGNPVAKTPFN